MHRCQRQQREGAIATDDDDIAAGAASGSVPTRGAQRPKAAAPNVVLAGSGWRVATLGDASIRWRGDRGPCLASLVPGVLCAPKHSTRMVSRSLLPLAAHRLAASCSRAVAV